jgi:GGDEF domain-containing protein
LRLDWSFRSEGLRLSGASWLQARAGDLIRDLGKVASDMAELEADESLARPFRDPNDRSRAQVRLQTFAKRNPEYAQVRLIDERGRELIRVDNRNDQIVVLPLSELQDKRTRDYVLETRRLAPGTIHVSRLDLNIEHGTVEWPPNPQVRFSARLPSEPDGPGGMLVLNLKGQGLLDRLTSTQAQVPKGGTWLVDGAGEYLLAPDDESQWGFVLGHGRALITDHPDLWRAINGGADVRAQGEDGPFQYLRFAPLLQARANAQAVGGDLVARTETERWTLMTRHDLAPWYHPQGIALVVLPLLGLGGSALALIAALGLRRSKDGKAEDRALEADPPVAPVAAACQWILEPDGDLRWLDLSPEARALFGLAEGESPPMEASDRARLAETLARVVRVQGDIAVDGRFVWTTGRIVWWRASARLAQSGHRGDLLINGALMPLTAPATEDTAPNLQDGGLRSLPDPQDPDTGLPGFQTFLNEGDALFPNRADGRGSAPCVVVARLDSPSAIAERLGAQALEDATKVLAERLETLARVRGCPIGRLRGRSIGILVPRGEQAEAMSLADHMRRTVHDTPARLGGPTVVPLPLTISLGIALCRPGDPSFAETVKRAAQAAADAERAGGDRILVAGTPES